MSNLEFAFMDFKWTRGLLEADTILSNVSQQRARACGLAFSGLSTSDLLIFTMRMGKHEPQLPLHTPSPQI